MSLTGIPLILLAAALAVLAAAATVRFWRRGAAVRIPGLLVLEILTVLTVGLVANRHEGFYPSWQALGGGQDSETVAPAPTGRLDAHLVDGSAVPWMPPDAARWRLARTAVLVVPTGYTKRTNVAFPVIVVLTTIDRVATVRAPADALTVVAVPTRDTTAADLADLPTQLAQDARATAGGWAIVADATHSVLARQWHNLVPGRFRTVAGSVDQAAERLPPALTAPIRLPS
jgi:hypothetical protein